MSLPLDQTSIICPNTFLTKLNAFIIALDTFRSTPDLVGLETSSSCGPEDCNQLRAHIELCQSEILAITDIQKIVQHAIIQSAEWELDKQAKLMAFRVSLMVHKAELQITVREFRTRISG